VRWTFNFLDDIWDFLNLTVTARVESHCDAIFTDIFYRINTSFTPNHTPLLHLIFFCVFDVKRSRPQCFYYVGFLHPTHVETLKARTSNELLRQLDLYKYPSTYTQQSTVFQEIWYGAPKATSNLLIHSLTSIKLLHHIQHPLQMLIPQLLFPTSQSPSSPNHILDLSPVYLSLS